MTLVDTNLLIDATLAAGAGGGTLETSPPEGLAVDEVRARSVKGVASAVGEGSVMIHEVHGYLESLPAAPART